MATRTKKPRTKTRRPKQPFLGEEVAEPSIPALDNAADNYYDAMMDRVKLSKEEDEAKDNLIDKMKEHGLERYVTGDGLVVSVLNKSNVKCKKRKDAEPSENGEAE